MSQSTQIPDNTLFELGINQESRYHLFETGRWAKFIAIVGFIFIGLMIAYGFFMGTMFDKLYRLDQMEEETLPTMPGNMIRVMLVLYTLIFGVIYFFPCYFTLRFANDIKTALTVNDQVKLTDAFRNLKRTTRYLGILTIIFLVLMVVGLTFFLTMFNSIDDFRAPQ